MNKKTTVVRKDIYMPLMLKISIKDSVKRHLIKHKLWFIKNTDFIEISNELAAKIYLFREQETDLFQNFQVEFNYTIYDISLHLDAKYKQAFINIHKKVVSDKLPDKNRNINWMFAELFDKIPFDIAIYDANLRYVNVSSNAIKNVDVRNWIIGKTDNDYFEHYKKDISIGKNRTKLILQTKKTKKPIEFIEKTVKQDSTILYAKKQVFPIFDSDGNITYYLGFSSDISAEENFKNTTSSILNSIEDIIFEVNEKFVFTNAWASDDALFFMPKQKFLGKRLKNVLGELGELFENTIKEVFESKELKIINYKHPLGDQYFQARISLIRHQDDVIVKKAVVSVRDVTKEKEKDKLIQSKKSVINKLVNHSEDIVFLIDGKFNLIEHNLIFAKFFNLGSKNKLDNNFYHYIIKKEDKFKWISSLKSLTLNPSSSIDLTLSYNIDGKVVKIEYVLTPILNHLAQLENILIIGRNITKYLELNNLLLDAKKFAEQNMKVKEQFLFNMSHEIRTPLNSINSAIHLLEDKTIDTNLLSYILIIKKSSNHLLRLLNDILDLSKLQTGKLRVASRKVNINALLDEILAAFDEDAKRKKNIITKFSAIPNNLYIISDEVRLRQMLFNIIGNSIKFTKNGKIDVSIALTQNDTQLEIRISDTGVGIEKNRLGKIFNGISAKSKTFNPNEGAGLGLNISYKLVELLKGYITVDSKVGEGSSFLICLPVLKANVSDYKKNTKALTLKNNLIFKGEKILIVEDHDFNRIFLANLLKSKMLDVDMACNGIQAIKLVKVKSYDLILMDLSMPKMDGFEATEKIRNVLNIQTPILAITAHTEKKVYYNCLKAGMNGLIKKPYDPAKLFSKIKYVINKNKLSDEKQV